MRKGQCPKSGSVDVRSGSQVPNKQGGLGINTIPITFWSHAPLDNYVSIGCGYVESYILDASKLEKITEKWPKVQPG